MAVEFSQRAILAVCPECKRAVTITNNHEVWPYVVCPCGWSGSTTDFQESVRVDEEGLHVR